MQPKNKRARALPFALAAFALAFAFAAPARAQEEAPPTVLDEPVAQVDNDVIMLSQLKRENAEFRDVLVKQRGMTPEQADAEVQKKQPEIIFNLINESLIIQKGKDMPRMTEDVEAEVNREVLRVAKGAGLNLEDLDEAMRREGMSLSATKETLRRQFMRQAVLQREVDSKVYYGLTDKELQDYYNANRAKFASITMSEIFLSLAGRSDEEVRLKAADLAKRARAGESFEALVEKNSEHEPSKKFKGVISDPENGKPRWFLLSDLSGEIAAAVKDLKAGAVSDPVKTEEGYMILRVNERDDSFKENFVRGVLTSERSDKAREEYLKTLRREAYIKPAEGYSGAIQPLLDKDRLGTAGPAQPGPSKKDKKK